MMIIRSVNTAITESGLQVCITELKRSRNHLLDLLIYAHWQMRLFMFCWIQRYSTYFIYGGVFRKNYKTNIIMEAGNAFIKPYLFTYIVNDI